LERIFIYEILEQNTTMKNQVLRDKDGRRIGETEILAEGTQTQRGRGSLATHGDENPKILTVKSIARFLLLVIAVALSACSRNVPPTDAEITEKLLPKTATQYAWDFKVVRIQRGKTFESDGKFGLKGEPVYPVRFTYSYSDFEIIRNSEGGRQEAVLLSQLVLERQFWKNEFGEWATNHR
jgi:hypothetical protein